MANYDVKVGQTMDLVNEGLGKYKDRGVSVRFKKEKNEYRVFSLGGIYKKMVQMIFAGQKERCRQRERKCGNSGGKGAVG